jgi:hypothetical protein
VVVSIGQVRKTADAATQIPGERQEGDLGEKVGRGQPVGEGARDDEEVQGTLDAAVEQGSGRMPEKAGGEVPSAKNWTLSDRAVPPVDQEPSLGAVRMVSVQGADTGVPVQVLPSVEGAAEDAVDGGAKGDWNGEEPRQNPRPVCG